jgi:hypothetical protein
MMDMLYYDPITGESDTSDKQNRRRRNRTVTRRDPFGRRRSRQLPLGCGTNRSVTHDE